jgi:DNA-binding protein HU-beta
MNKSELIDQVAEQTGMTKAQTAQAVEATFATIQNALKNQEDVKIVGFGAFTVSERAATTGRNPRTGEEIKIPASKSAKFKAGKELKDAVNK